MQLIILQPTLKHKIYVLDKLKDTILNIFINIDI